MVHLRLLQPTLSPEGLTSVCALSNLETLDCTIVTTPTMDLTQLAKLTSLTTLRLKVYEDFAEIKLNPVWLSSLPLTLRHALVVCTSKWQASNANYSTFRTFAQCLPHFTRLLNLRCLDLRVGGKVSADSLKHLTSLPLQRLFLSRAEENAPECYLEEHFPTVKALSQLKSLGKLGIPLLSQSKQFIAELKSMLPRIHILNTSCAESNPYLEL